MLPETVMTISILGKLRAENKSLRKLIIELSSMMLKNATEQRQLIENRDSERAHGLLVVLTPAETVARLRQAAMLCTRLSANCSDIESSRTLEGLGVELAAEAETLKLALKKSE
jgi:hypothetical protein